MQLRTHAANCIRAHYLVQLSEAEGRHEANMFKIHTRVSLSISFKLSDKDLYEHFETY